MYTIESRSKCRDSILSDRLTSIAGPCTGDIFANPVSVVIVSLPFEILRDHLAEDPDKSDL
jgi:hypothetical protein